MQQEVSPEAREHAEEAQKVSHWLTEIELAEKDKYYSEWCKRCEKVEKRYRDERGLDLYSDTTRNKKFNIFWSNVQTLQPAIYSRLPKPEVKRRFNDADPLARSSSQILERGIDFNMQSFDFDSVLVLNRDDYLLFGRSQSWLRYVPEFGPMVDEFGQPVLNDDGTPAERIVSEKVVADFLNHQDFLHNPARTWDEVRWVARRVHMSRDELITRFGQEKAQKVSLDYVPDHLEKRDVGNESAQEQYKKACVWEVWDKPTKTAMWFCKGYSQWLDRQDDPLGLSNFFPCPKPLLGVTTSKTLIPVPEFALYQDQADELDEMTSRISLLTKALRVVGVYNAARPELVRLLSEGVENEMIPVDDWASFAQSSGLEGSMDFMPLEDVIRTLIQLYDARERVKQEIYELTGIADIIRGSSNASETATAQQIKGQFATLRLADRQRAVQRFARDIIAIMGEIIAEKFAPETLAMISGLTNLDEATQANFEAARALLADDVIRDYRIDIETDSTVSIDENQDKQSRIEFMQAVTPFIDKSMQVIQTTPAFAPLMTELLMFTVRGFKAGRQLESALEQAMQTAQQMAQQAQQQQPPPDPAMMKAQADMQMQQMKFDLEAQKAQMQAQLAQQKAQVDLELKQATQMLDIQKAQFTAALEEEKLRGTLELQAEKVRADMMLKAMQAPMQEQIKTNQQLEIPTAAAPQPIIVNVDARQPVRKMANIMRDANGNMQDIMITDVPEAQTPAV